MRDFAFDPAFRGQPMIDYFLTALGAAPATVPSAMRRNTWLAPRITPTGPPATAPAGHILVCPDTASDLRSMPPEVHSRILARLAVESTEPVLTQSGMKRAETLAELCGLVAGARLVISADTAMVHLADAFDIPTLAFFTTHRPEWRVRDYPLCTPIHLPPAGLPEALEFIRTPADIAACRAAWFARGADLAWLDPLIAGAVGRAR